MSGAGILANAGFSTFQQMRKPGSIERRTPHASAKFRLSSAHFTALDSTETNTPNLAPALSVPQYVQVVAVADD
ncbi:hypothetical protein IFR05_005875 [Cadophora sp. M221]|nr:hypothetical protein IFR05_005875 [Cadophora sp. M221]